MSVGLKEKKIKKKKKPFFVKGLWGAILTSEEKQ